LESKDEKQGKKPNILDVLDGRKQRAAARLEKNQNRAFCFALLGLQTAVTEFDFAPGIRLQPVEDPPNEIELARALKNAGEFIAVSRYSRSIRYELAVTADLGDTPQTAMDVAWWILSALRVRSLTEILVPVVADYSWSTIAGLEKNSCVAQLLEDVPRSRRLAAPVTVALSDFEWVATHLLDFSTLLDNSRFRLATEALCTHQHHPTNRMMAAVLWSGIEALFGVQHELSFRIACYTASVLEPRGQSRLDILKRL
jgi:hypothetical protein